MSRNNLPFQWLGANEADLHDFKSKIKAAGTVCVAAVTLCHFARTPQGSFDPKPKATAAAAKLVGGEPLDGGMYRQPKFTGHTQDPELQVGP